MATRNIGDAMRRFQIHIQNACEEWTDYNLYRHALHDITLTHYRPSDTWDGMIRLAKTAQADFGEERQLSPSIIHKLATLISQKGD